MALGVCILKFQPVKLKESSTNFEHGKLRDIQGDCSEADLPTCYLEKVFWKYVGNLQ